MTCFLPTWFWEVPLAKLRAALPAWFDNAALRLQSATSHLVRDRLSPLHVRLAPVSGAALPDPAPGDDGIRSRLARFVSLPKTLTSETSAREGLATGEGTPSGSPAGSEPRMLRSSLVSNLLAFALLLYVLCWNLTTVSALTMPERLVPVGPFLGLDQYWGMFAPSPSREDGWYVIPGNLRDGQRTDLMSVTRDDYGLHKVSWKKPQDVNATFKNEHWRKYLENLYSQQYADQRLYFGQYICRQWNARHTGAEQLETFKITYMLEMTQPNYKHSMPQKVVLWDHSCF
jgi:hypothetical protein